MNVLTPPAAERVDDQPVASGAKRFVDTLIRFRELGIVAALVIVLLATGVYNSDFLSRQGLDDLFLNASIIAILTVGQTFVVVARNVDLSVGSILGLSAFLSGDLFASNPHQSVALVIVAGTALGAACGVFNGLIVSAGRVPSLVVTLGTLYVFRGLDYAWAGGRQINADAMPDSFLHLGSGTAFGIPYLAGITVVLVAIGTYYLRSYRSGRELYAMGSSPDAAVLAGIPVGRRIFVAFIVSGAVAGLAGVLWAARYGTIDATAGTGYELQVIAAVVVGGVAIFGGSGTVVGAALGALLLTTIGSALVVLRVPAFWQQAIDGALLLAAIALDRFIGLRVAAALRQRSIRNG